MAFLTGTWSLMQQNGGPAVLGMTIAEDGAISLKLDGEPLNGYYGVAYASNPNPYGQYPVMMTIYCTTEGDGMGLSITNYVGVVTSYDVGEDGNVIVRAMMGTATGTGDYMPSHASHDSSSLQVYGWEATTVQI